MKQLCRVITDQYIGSTFNLHSFEIDEVGADTRPYLQLPAILISCSPSCRWVQRRGRNRCTGANTQVSGPSSPSEALHVGLSIVSTHFFFFLFRPSPHARYNWLSLVVMRVWGARDCYCGAVWCGGYFYCRSLHIYTFITTLDHTKLTYQTHLDLFLSVDFVWGSPDCYCGSV